MNEISVNGIIFHCNNSVYQAERGEKIAFVASIIEHSFHVRIKNLKTGNEIYEHFLNKDKAFKFAVDCLNKNN